MKFNQTIIAIVLLVSCLFTISVFAIEKPINQSINSSTWTAVSLNPGQTCSAYAFQARDKSVFKVSNTSDGAKYFTVKEDHSVAPTEHHGAPGSVLFYAQSESGSTIIEVFLINE